MTDLLDAIQWPAMTVTVGVMAGGVRAFVIGDARASGSFLASNALWVIQGLYGSAPALIVLQVCLAVVNVRGMLKARVASSPS